MTSKSRLYKDLELLTPGRARPSFRIRLYKAMRRLSSRLIRALTMAHEPKVYKIQTRDGQTLFEVYDPVTNEHVRVISEEEARIWLEQRY